jgi:transmembrane sensor
MVDEQLEKELSLARRAVPVFGLGRQQQVIWRVQRRLRVAPGSWRHRVLLVAAACLVGSLAAAFVWLRAPANEAASHATKDERWELRDGSRLVLETPETQLVKRRESSEEVAFELASGAARFDVAHRPERMFRVQAGLVGVEVLGTRFRVERRGERALVAVERGRVRVSWADTSQQLSEGEEGLFPPEQALARSAEPAPLPTEAPLRDELPRSDAQPLSPEKAVRALNAEQLFMTADRWRKEGRAEDAVRALKELTQRFPHDGRSPLAAFTRGRLLLENLHQPAEAARAFGQARSLAGGSSALAEDALAREADAWGASGNRTEATRCANLYRTLYPRGAHLKEVLRFIEPPPAR